MKKVWAFVVKSGLSLAEEWKVISKQSEETRQVADRGRECGTAIMQQGNHT